MTKKDYIKFAKVFKKAFIESKNQKEYEGKNINVSNWKTFYVYKTY